MSFELYSFSLQPKPPTGLSCPSSLPCLPNGICFFVFYSIGVKPCVFFCFTGTEGQCNVFHWGGLPSSIPEGYLTGACPVKFTIVTACQVEFMTMTAKRIQQRCNAFIWGSKNKNETRNFNPVFTTIKTAKLKSVPKITVRPDKRNDQR